MDEVNIIQNFNIVIGHPNGQSINYFTSSEKNLIDEYKNAILNKSDFLAWENGCFETKNVLGVFKN